MTTSSKTNKSREDKKEEFSEIRKELEKMLPPEKYFLDWESEVGGYEKIEAIDLIMDLFESKLSLVKKEAEARGFEKGKNHWAKICTEMNHELEYPKVGAMCTNLACAFWEKHVIDCPLYGQPYIK
jgi:hypothetical protein